MEDCIVPTLLRTFTWLSDCLIDTVQKSRNTSENRPCKRCKEGVKITACTSETPCICDFPPKCLYIAVANEKYFYQFFLLIYERFFFQNSLILHHFWLLEHPIFRISLSGFTKKKVRILCYKVCYDTTP